MWFDCICMGWEPKRGPRHGRIDNYGIVYVTRNSDEVFTWLRAWVSFKYCKLLGFGAMDRDEPMIMMEAHGIDVYHRAHAAKNYVHMSHLTSRPYLHD